MTTTPTSGAADLLAMVSKALREAYNLGQRYWQQADSEYISQHKKADDTRAKFLALVEETCAALAAGQATAAKPVAEPADTVVLNAAMRAIQQAIELIGAPTDERMRAVRRVLRGAVVVAEDSGVEVAAPAAPAQPAAQQPHRSGCTAGTDEECVQRGCGTNCPAVSPPADSVLEDAAWMPLTPELLTAIESGDLGNRFWIAAHNSNEPQIGVYEWRQGRNPHGFNSALSRYGASEITHVLPYKPPALPAASSPQARRKP